MKNLWDMAERLLFGATAEERVALLQAMIDQRVEQRLNRLADALDDNDNETTFQPGDAAVWQWQFADRYRATRPDLCGRYPVTIIGPSEIAPGLIDCRDEGDGHVFQAQPCELTPAPAEEVR